MFAVCKNRNTLCFWKALYLFVLDLELKLQKRAADEKMFQTLDVILFGKRFLLFLKIPNPHGWRMTCHKDFYSKLMACSLPCWASKLSSMSNWITSHFVHLCVVVSWYLVSEMLAVFAFGVTSRRVVQCFHTPASLVPETSSALSCKYHQQLMAYKLLLV